MAAGSRLFSDKLDRVAFSAYFLGAVVPLIALAVVVERFALPTLTDRNDSLGLIGVVISAALLSLGSFLVLRHRTHHSLDRMDSNNRRLTALLQVSSELAAVQHVTEATHCAAEQALQLANATAAYLFLHGANDEEPALAAAAGEDAPKLYERLEQKLSPLPRMIFESQRPVLRGAEDGEDFAALAVPMPGESAPIGVLLVVRTAPATGFTAEETDAVSTLAALAGVALNNGDLRDAQRNFFAHVTDILVSALDAHLEFNQGHGHRVAQVANRLGRQLQLDDATMQRLHFASLLHDIGMLKLDRKQQMNRKTCDKHPVIGSRMLGRIRLWKDIAPLVHHHHEWWDGSGYPEGIAELEIPLESRIIAVADAFDTMTSHTSYREARSAEEALAELEACQGTQFDPSVVIAFRELAQAGQLELPGA